MLIDLSHSQRSWEFLPNNVVTSAKEVMFNFFSAYLLAVSGKNYWPDLHENFTRDVSLDKEELDKI